MLLIINFKKYNNTNFLKNNISFSLRQRIDDISVLLDDSRKTKFTGKNITEIHTIPHNVYFKPYLARDFVE